MARRSLRINVVLLVSYLFIACSSFSEADSPVSPDLDGGFDSAMESSPDAHFDPAEAAPSEDAGDAFLVLGMGFSNLRDVVANQQSAYVAEQLPGGVHPIPLPGTSQTSKVAQSGAPTALVAAGDSLFWFDNNSGGSLHTWNPELDTMDSSSQSLPLTALAAGGPYLAAVIKGNGQTSGNIRLEMQTPLGTIFETLSTPKPFDVVMRDNDVYWTDADAIFHTSVDGTSNSVADTFAPCPDTDCEYIAANTEGVYWARPSSNAISGKLFKGTMIDIGGMEPAPSAIASDESGVYWIVADGRVRRWTAADDRTITLSSGFVVLQDMNARALALTSSYVIWITGDGRVLAHAK